MIAYGCNNGEGRMREYYSTGQWPIGERLHSDVFTKIIGTFGEANHLFGGNIPDYRNT